MNLNLKYIWISIKIDPRGKWALIFLGLGFLFMGIDQLTYKYLMSINYPTFSSIGWALFGASAVKVFEYVKIREEEIQMDKEIELRHQELICDGCNESFTFVQDWNIHLLNCPKYKEKNKNSDKLGTP